MSLEICSKDIVGFLACDPSECWVPIDIASSELGITAHWIRKLIKEGYIESRTIGTARNGRAYKAINITTFKQGAARSDWKDKHSQPRFASIRRTIEIGKEKRPWLWKKVGYFGMKTNKRKEEDIWRENKKLLRGLKQFLRNREALK